MATDYPTGIDSFTAIVPGNTPGVSTKLSDEVGGRSHADIINDLQAGLVATTLGTDPQGAAVVGDKMWECNFNDGGTKISWIYLLRNTGTELFRCMVI